MWQKDKHNGLDNAKWQPKTNWRENFCLGSLECKKIYNKN